MFTPLSFCLMHLIKFQPWASAAMCFLLNGSFIGELLETHTQTHTTSWTAVTKIHIFYLHLVSRAANISPGVPFSSPLFPMAPPSNMLISFWLLLPPVVPPSSCFQQMSLPLSSQEKRKKKINKSNSLFSPKPINLATWAAIISYLSPVESEKISLLFEN